MVPEAANHGEFVKPTAHRAEVYDLRLHIPSEVYRLMPWYTPGARCAVIIELREIGAIRVHDGKRQADLDRQREIVMEGFEDKTEARRRIALSQSVFILGAVGEGNRKLGLPASVLAHLGIVKKATVLCLAYAHYFEVLSEERAAELTEIMRIDINLDDASAG
jgi:hypothetical protein